MIGVVLVTHGDLAWEFRQALEHVVGPQEAFETICMGPEDDMERCRDDIVRAVVAGVNLPMLIKFARVRETKSLKDAVHAAAKSGRNYITVASDVMAS